MHIEWFESCAQDVFWSRENGLARQVFVHDFASTARISTCDGSKRMYVSRYARRAFVARWAMRIAFAALERVCRRRFWVGLAEMACGVETTDADPLATRLESVL